MKEVMDAKDIAFPHLGIYLENVDKEISIFGFEIAYYGIVICLGMLLGIILSSHIAKKEKFDTDVIWDFAIFAIIFSVIGARIYYVAFSWSYYKENLIKIFMLRQGGLAIFGGIIGGLITLFVYCKIKKLNYKSLADIAVFGLTLGQIIGRFGNFFNREAFGDYTDSLFAMRLPLEALRSQSDVTINHIEAMALMGEDVNFIQVHPTFLYESLWNLCLLIGMLLFRRHKKFEGQMTLIYLGGYGLGRFIIEGLRTDKLYIPNTNIPVSQMLGLILFIFSVAANVYILIFKRKKRIRL